jgi:crotonobetainyl-CoA:carnitine CoA-transferase CaiB-like acyl-CoA transferase
MAALAADPCFATNQARVTNRAALLALIEPLVAQKGIAHWLEALRAAGVPCGAVRGVGAALASPEAAAREMVVEVAHPSAGAVPLVASPLKLGGTPVAAPVAPPLLGEHSDEVLRELLGLSGDEIGALRNDGIVA